jgi:hypothetical protein
VIYLTAFAEENILQQAEKVRPAAICSSPSNCAS